MTRVENTPAFLIHRRMYQGSSLLLDFFTKDFGRLRLVARGARKSKTSLQMFQCLSISFKGKGELKNLSQWEIADKPRRILGDDLILAMYVNELILRLLPENDEYSEIFNAYWNFLSNLKSLNSNEKEYALRDFENQMLDDLGYGIDFSSDMNDEPINENLNYDGTRALDGGDGAFRSGIKDGGKAKKIRCYVTKENTNQFPHLTNFIEELRSEKVYKKIGALIGKDLSNSYVRLEVICDREGFWLKPHCDIKEKLMSSIIFINLHNESENLGTDFYDKNLTKVKTVPYKHNYGYFFTSGPESWHGMEKKEIKKERRCIQVNYVTFPTDWKVY